MAAKKTTKAGAAKKSTRPKLGSSHAKQAPAGPRGRTAAGAGASPRPSKRPSVGRGAGGGGGEDSGKAFAGRPRPRAAGANAPSAARTAAKGSVAKAPAKTAAKRVALAAPKRAAADGSPGMRPKKAKPSAPLLSSLASDDARELAIAIAVAGLEKKAVGLEILDVAGKVDYADFLVIMTGRSDRQVAALAQGIEEALGQKGKRAISIEGLPHANWVLMDFGDVVVHVFQDEARSVYDIEGLWMDAKRVAVPAEAETR